MFTASTGIVAQHNAQKKEYNAAWHLPKHPYLKTKKKKNFMLHKQTTSYQACRDIRHDNLQNLILHG